MTIYKMASFNNGCHFLFDKTRHVKKMPVKKQQECRQMATLREELKENFPSHRRVMRPDDFGQGILVRRFVRHLIRLVQRRAKDALYVWTN